MKRSDLKPGMHVAVSTRLVGRAHLGQGQAREVTVLDGPYDSVYDRDANDGKGGYVYKHGKGRMWKVLASHRGPTGLVQKEQFVESRDILGAWADHVAEGVRLNEEARKQADRREALRLEADQWSDLATDACKALGLNWSASRRAGSSNVIVPVHVLDRLIELASARADA